MGATGILLQFFPPLEKDLKTATSFFHPWLSLASCLQWRGGPEGGPALSILLNWTTLKLTTSSFCCNTINVFIAHPTLVAYTEVPPYLQFCFLQFQLPVVNWGPNILSGILQK